MRDIGSSLLFFFTLMLFSAPGCAQGNASAKPQVRKFKHNSKVESLYDKAKDQTTTYLRPMTVTSVPGSIDVARGDASQSSMIGSADDDVCA